MFALVGLASVLLPLAGPALPAGAVAPTVPPNQVITASPSAGLTAPADGRLRGQNVTATVTGVAWPGSVESDGAIRVAGPGRRLVVFTLRLSQPTGDVGPLAGGTAATAVVADADALRAEALAHVRGVPFDGMTGAQYGWALDGPVHEMTAAVVGCADTLATSRLAAGDPAGATTAARAGLRVSRTELALWRDLFAAARASEDPGAVRRLQAEARRVLDRELADRLAGETGSA